jgi:hypothetical protein
MPANGLAKFRGRLKQLSYQTSKEASRVNLFIFSSKPIVVACWCLLIALDFQMRHQRP